MHITNHVMRHLLLYFPFVFFNCLQISEAPTRVCVDMEMCMENRFALTIINLDFSLFVDPIRGVNNKPTPSNATVKFLLTDFG